MPYFIAGGCIDVMDRSCLDECPVDCIYEGQRKLYIQPGECIDCGACEPVCPESAIYADWTSPAGEREFLADNERFFSEPLPGRAEPIGSPGGSGGVDAAGADTPLVQSWRTAKAPQPDGPPASPSHRPPGR
jgi:NAD-dependent dihydropyrimidine dehydrogenase PreA subunit